MQKSVTKDNFNIILLAAGLSKRLGGEQKIVKEFNGKTLLFYSLTASLLSADTTLVVGHEREKVIEEAHTIILNNHFNHKLEIVFNENYKNGQYTSIQKGVQSLTNGKDFCIMTGDVPFIKSEDYLYLYKELGKSDVLRPFVDGVPCHPVFLNSRMRQFIINHSDVTSVRDLLTKYSSELKIRNFDYRDNPLLTRDFDYQENFNV